MCNYIYNTVTIKPINTYINEIKFKNEVSQHSD